MRQFFENFKRKYFPSPALGASFLFAEYMGVSVETVNHFPSPALGASFLLLEAMKFVTKVNFPSPALGASFLFN